MVERHQQRKESADKNKDLERVPIAQVEVLKAIKTPGAHHEEADGNQQRKPQRRKLRPQDGISAYQVDSCSNDASARRNWQADEILSSRSPWIRWLRIYLNIESRQPACACDQKNERRYQPQLHHLVMHGGKSAIRQQTKSPHPCQQRRCNAERDYVRQRIKFATKIAGGVGHARNAAIQSVSHYGNANRHGCMVKVPEVLRCALQRLAQGVITRADVCSS